MNPFESELERRLEALRAHALLRRLRRVGSAQAPRIRVDGIGFLSFSSNDYLGLANDPSLKEAAIRAVERFGAGCGASRLVCGSLAPHHELEETLATFLGTEAALTFSTGYAAALGTLQALIGRNDILILDKLVHASIVDAARLTGARIRVFPHNDLNALEHLLKWAASRAASSGDGSPHCRTLVLTESVFSMDGDRAPLREIAGLKDRYGAWLMIDEAHATGLYGQNRRGLAEELGVRENVDVHLGTLGKAIGAGGGFICGSRRLIDFLANRARSFAFSTAPVPAAAAAAAAGVRLVASEEGARRLQCLWSRVEQFEAEMRGTAPGIANAGSPIIPWIIGTERDALAVSERLQDRGLFIPAIRYPTVARNKARLRITLTAAHSAEEIRTLSKALKSLVQPTT